MLKNDIESKFSKINNEVKHQRHTEKIKLCKSINKFLCCNTNEIQRNKKKNYLNEKYMFVS